METDNKKNIKFDPAELSDEQLAELSNNGNNIALDFLLKKYSVLVRRKARTYFLVGADHEDIVQEGMIGLFKAIQSYNPEKQSGFRAFAELCITRQMITAIKSATRQKHAPLNSYISLDRPLFDEEYEVTLMDVIGSDEKIANPEDIIIGQEQYKSMEQSLAKELSSFEREVLAYYLQGKTYQEIGDILQKNYKSIDNALQRIKKKIEKMRV
ncbi:MAG: RNA polymerase sporulation sigma factor SigH [Clostridia bacterium]|nr:RNA polymerase sporulation sigma factor SigH [Clostridia bacterium]